MKSLEAMLILYIDGKGFTILSKLLNFCNVHKISGGVFSVRKPPQKFSHTQGIMSPKGNVAFRKNGDACFRWIQRQIFFGEFYE